MVSPLNEREMYGNFFVVYIFIFPEVCGRVVMERVVGLIKGAKRNSELVKGRDAFRTRRVWKIKMILSDFYAIKCNPRPGYIFMDTHWQTFWI